MEREKKKRSGGGRLMGKKEGKQGESEMVIDHLKLL